MGHATKTVILMMLLPGLRLEAQVAGAFGSPSTDGGPAATGQQTANALVVGTSTGVVYDSNALSSRPPISDFQYTLYPLVGLRLDRPRWDARMYFAPGLSYSSANLPEYQALSLKSDVRLQYRPTERLSVEFNNYLVSSSNPFDSFSSGASTVSAGNGTGSAGNGAGSVANLNYLPKTNELVTTDVAYSLTPRTSLKMLASYNYLDYAKNPGVSPAMQPFQQSNTTQVSMGISHDLSPRYSETFHYVGQLFDSGQGRVKTVGQSFQYEFLWAPTPTLRLSVTAGPEHLQTEYSAAGRLSGIANLATQRASEWTLAARFSISEIFGKNSISATVSQQPSIGNQYQGVVQQTVVEGNLTRQLVGKAALVLFGSYSLSTPVSIGQNILRLSNNYSSSGATISKTLADHWVVACSYWYLFQNQPPNAEEIYSGNHNRVAFSLSYTLTRPLKQ
jgi:hypothetical protein